MPFQELQSILGAIEPHYQSLERQQIQRIQEHWTELMGGDLAKQTQLIALQRNVLEVATANPGWTQTLVFKRSKILQQIRDRLGIDLSDIRCSTVQWRPEQDRSVLEEDLWENHPSQISPVAPQVETQLALFQNSQSAFDRWSARIQQRSQHLPLCPNCNTPTPPGELDRWSVCAICAANA
jgi:predicted nucleic acid-binding Zn ribbon protein